MPRYNIKGGYLELEPADDAIRNISEKLLEISKSTPAKEVGEVKSPEDLQKVGERKGDPEHFLKEK